MEVTAHRARAVVDADEAKQIVAALMSDAAVPDTRGFSPAGLRVAEFLAQHAAGDRYTTLYPAPETDTYGQRLPDPFTAIGSSQVCDLWQLNYEGVVHPNVPRVPPLLSVGMNWHAKTLNKNNPLANNLW